LTNSEAEAALLLISEAALLFYSKSRITVHLGSRLSNINMEEGGFCQSQKCGFRQSQTWNAQQYGLPRLQRFFGGFCWGSSRTPRPNPLLVPDKVWALYMYRIRAATGRVSTAVSTGRGTACCATSAESPSECIPKV
jgi:hypothetical protein